MCRYTSHFNTQMFLQISDEPEDRNSMKPQALGIRTNKLRAALPRSELRSNMLSPDSLICPQCCVAEARGSHENHLILHLPLLRSEFIEQRVGKEPTSTAETHLECTEAKSFNSANEVFHQV